jgi:isocitrate lyase
MRTLAYAPYSDLNWLETKEPNLAQAQGFAKIIREAHPNKYVAFTLDYVSLLPLHSRERQRLIICVCRPGRWLVYNLSPSFNWSVHGFSEAQLKSFVWDLASSGFVLQLISLAGLHSTAVVTGTSLFPLPLWTPLSPPLASSLSPIPSLPLSLSAS